MKKIAFISSIFFSIVGSAQTVSSVAGNGNTGYNGDGGQATAASIGGVGDVAFDSYGNFYITELNNTIRKISASGIISKVAGNGTQGYGGDNGLAINAPLYLSGYVAIDKSGNIYLSEIVNNRIRRVDAVTGIITTIVGDGTAGFGGDNGIATSAQVNFPYGICFDKNDNLYFADQLNYRIRKVDAVTGIITTIAGNGIAGSGGDGGLAISATIYSPLGICVDTSDNIYFTDSGRIRKISSSTGVISAYAGNGTIGNGGDGGQATLAELYFPVDVTVDNFGNLYISNENGNNVRVVDATGLIHSIIGTGIGNYNGDGGNADTTELYSPRGIGLDSCSNLYVADNGNRRVRKVTFDSTCAIGAPLAIQLLSFTGTATATGNVLYWQTSNEQSISKFELQRSEDGRTFNKIASIAAKSNSTSYSYTDETAQNTCYYRLKILETRGAYSYSDVVATRRSGNSNAISLYPNPVREQLTVTGGNDIVVTNTLGQAVMNARCDNYQTSIDVSGLKNGLYYITAQDTNGAISRLKFVKE